MGKGRTSQVCIPVSKEIHCIRSRTAMESQHDGLVEEGCCGWGGRGRIWGCKTGGDEEADGEESREYRMHTACCLCLRVLRCAVETWKLMNE
jgi:hypothetical protein